MSDTQIVRFPRLDFAISVFIGLLQVVISDREVAVLADKLLILVVAAPESDGFLRFMQSANYYNYSVEVLGGTGQHTGNGWRTRILMAKMSMLSKQDSLVVMILDSNDVILAGGPEDSLKKFRKFNCKVVLAAEWQVWWNEHSGKGFPVMFNRKRPSGALGAVRPPFAVFPGMMGYASDISKVLEWWDPPQNMDELLFYGRMYTDPLLRMSGICSRNERLDMTMDDRCEIFQTLNGELGEVLLKFGPEETRVRNTIYDTLPVVIQGSRNTRVTLNYLGNYIPNIWTYKNGCRICNHYMLDPSNFKEYPRVTLGVFIERPTPFVLEFLERLLALDYPKDCLSVFLYNKEAYHKRNVQTFWMESGKVFQSFEVMGPDKQLTSGGAREMGMDLCRRNTECGYYFSFDADVMLTNNRTLRLLIEQNRKIIAPPSPSSSNFWGALSADGYFARSEDYLDMVHGRRVGVWNVPYVAHSYLIKGETLRAELRIPSAFTLERMDPDMALCGNARELGIFMHVTNRHLFSRLISTIDYKTSHYNGDLRQIFENPVDWKEKYVHSDYSRIFTEDIVEQDGWQIAGHESFLASDIHMAQMNFEKQWLYFIREIISPVIAKVFFGYSTKGGGCKFQSYNCSMESQRKGWGLIHPGIMTHSHEDLPTTSGPHYIAMSFIDP